MTHHRAFTKMHGLGNDFVVLDVRHGQVVPDPVRMAHMADRHTGIGFDQLLTIEPPAQTDSLAAYRIWNADGSAAGQCGNGVRCVAAWLHRAGDLPLDRTVTLDSPAGPVQVRVLSMQRVTVDMGEPCFEPVRIPLRMTEQQAKYRLQVAGRELTFGAVTMGNPHAVVEVESLDDPALEILGPALTAHEAFPDGCNAGFVRRSDTARLELRVHERGSGWTRACGTGACAAAAVMHQWGKVGDHVEVHLPGGLLQIDWAGPGHALWMTGPAAFVFDGDWLTTA